jgi:hypothetical protein
MINKRLLIKNLLAHSDENSFYDKKQQLDFSSKEGKAKFLKHVCALSNSNPHNNSYLVIGVKDEDSSIMGVDFFDDSKIQNLVNAYLDNPPFVTYENVSFPHLPEHKFVGLVIIRSKNDTKPCSLQKHIWKYYKGTVFSRVGSTSKPQEHAYVINEKNRDLVASIEKNSQNSIGLTLDGVFDFMNRSKDFNPNYKVFKEYFVLCWAGKAERFQGKTYYSRVNIELINEQVKLFYSYHDKIEIEIKEDSFNILEYINLGLPNQKSFYPLERTGIRFKDNMTYDIETEMVFQPPKFNQKTLRHFLNYNEYLLNKMKLGQELTPTEIEDLNNLPSIYLIGYLSGIDAEFSGIEKLEQAKKLIKKESKTVYNTYKDTMRILRKIKYS